MYTCKICIFPYFIFRLKIQSNTLFISSSQKTFKMHFLSYIPWFKKQLQRDHVSSMVLSVVTYLRHINSKFKWKLVTMHGFRILVYTYIVEMDHNTSHYDARNITVANTWKYYERFPCTFDSVWRNNHIKI